MATLTPKTLYVGNTTAANVYSVLSTTGNYTIVKNFTMTNANTSTAKTISIYILNSGNTIAAENRIYISNLSIPANGVIQIDTSLILSNTHAIYVTHTGNVTLTVSGVEYA